MTTSRAAADPGQRHAGRAALLAEALSTRAGRRVELLAPQRGDKRKLVEHALINAREALARRLAESASQVKLLTGVAELFGLDAPPQRIEVYDNSHIQGSNAVGAMIVAGPEGFMKTGLSQVHHQGRRHDAGRRFRDDARGAGPALRPRLEGGSRARARAIGPTSS